MSVPSRAVRSTTGRRWRLPPRAAPPGVVLLHHRLAGYSSHHFSEAQGFVRELARRGTPLRLLVNTRAPPAIAGALGARAVLDDPTFRMEWSFAERSRRFIELLRAHVEPELRAADCVLLTVATQLETHALVRWLQDLPRAKKPWIALMPLPYGRPPVRPAHEAAPQRPRVAVFGGMRREKGSHLLPELVRACRAHADVEFLVQLANNTRPTHSLHESLRTRARAMCFPFTDRSD
jgi:hypothetical protein